MALSEFELSPIECGEGQVKYIPADDRQFRRFLDKVSPCQLVGGCLVPVDLGGYFQIFEGYPLHPEVANLIRSTYENAFASLMELSENLN